MSRGTVHAIMVAAMLLSLWPARVHAECAQNGGPLALGNLTETFESPSGLDNQYEILLDPGNQLNSIFLPPKSPPLWGKRSGRVVVGPQHGAAAWMKRDNVESPTGYHFTASFLILVDGLLEGQAITLFVSKPMDWAGPWAAWRLYFYRHQGQLNLVLILGLNTTTNNPSAAEYLFPIANNQIYDVAILYDTRRWFYSWSVNGQVQAASNMPCDYPLIGTKIIGSSGSSDGRNSAFAVDNVRWYELPE